jgi:catechol 2,3-dioxygenase-like lactoylglutathione lyase family enzyme
MERRLALVTFLVREYDEAITFFTGSLKFSLEEDTLLAPGKRWVRVAPAGANGTCLLLARAATPEQQEHVGRQGGGRVFLFLQTDNFQRDFDEMRRRGVQFLEEPRTEAYGKVAVFADLYGNKWDLLELKNK